MANDSDLPQPEAQRADSAVEIHGVHRTDASPPRFGRFALCMAAAGALAFGVFGTVAYGVWFNHDQQAYAEAIAGARQALGMPVAATLGASGAAAGMSLKAVVLAGPTSSAAGAQAPATNTVTSAPAFAPAMTAATSNAPLTIASPNAQTQTIASPPSTSQASLASDNGAVGEQGGKQAVWSGPIAKTPVAQTPVTASSLTILADTASATPSAPAPSPRSPRRATSSTDSATQQSTVARPGKDVRTAQPERRASSTNANANANASAKHKDGLFARVGQFFRRVNYPQHDSGRQQQDLYSHP